MRLRSLKRAREKLNTRDEANSSLGMFARCSKASCSLCGIMRHGHGTSCHIHLGLYCVVLSLFSLCKNLYFTVCFCLFYLCYCFHRWFG